MERTPDIGGIRGQSNIRGLLTPAASRSVPGGADKRGVLRILRKRSARPSIPSPATVPTRVEDVAALLGRPVVKLDTPEIQRFLAGKRVLITGAGGSIGSEIARQAMRFCPGRLALLDRSEYGLFEIDRELRERWVGSDLRAVIADVADEARVASILADERPHVIFHAAAHKHVPLMEANPGEAIKNNVLGTHILATAAAEVGVASFVLISTDKAVNPTSVMGATKRCAEMVVQGMNIRSDEAAERRRDEGNSGAVSSDSGPFVASSLRRSVASAFPRFSAVRFGNVLGSSGSVVPIFARQIATGGPVTVTHPEMRRFFMTIPEAAGLVMQAGSIGQGGEIFVLDMGEQVRILELAEAMIRRAGLRPYEEIPIRFTGIRPGEKLEEELAGADEPTLPTGHPKIRVWELPQVTPTDVTAMLERLESVIDAPRPAVLAALRDCVPEFAGDAGEGARLRLAKAA